MTARTNATWGRAAGRGLAAVALALALGLGACADPGAAGPAGDGVGTVEAPLAFAPSVELVKKLNLCGGPKGLTCGKGQYCRTRSCDDGSWGLCEKRPFKCPAVVKPVCGCDGETYRNACYAARAGVTVAHEGKCGKPKVCGTIQGLTCAEGDVCIFAPGTCDWADQAGECVTPPEVCPLYWAPVCGCDGVTYGNPCEATAAGASIDHKGPCCEPVLCDLWCPYGYQLDENGCEICKCNPPPDLCEGFVPPGCVQSGCKDGYVCDQTVGCNPSACKCDPLTGAIVCTDDCGGGTCVPEKPAPCGGIAGFVCPSKGQVCIYPPGTCDIVDNMGECVFPPEACTKEYAPVCGCDGKTYGNKCMATMAGASIDHEGACCEPVLCDLYCEFGFKVDESGCEICECNPPPTDLCADFVPPGCKQSGCPKGYVCDPSVGCNPSICSCDPANGFVICTADCGGGTCVPAEPAPCGGIAGLQCPSKDQVCIYPPGECGILDGSGECVVPPEACTKEYAPVCGCDGHTYGNKCMALMAGASIDHAGPCCEPVACTLYCEWGFKTDENGCEICECNPPPADLCCDPAKMPKCTFGSAVCCYNGTWMCPTPSGPICLEGKVCPDEPAMCGGFAGFTCPDKGDVCIYPPGTCNVADNLGECVTPPEACIQIYDPVCGCDGKTYGNACTATAAGVSIDHDGACCTGLLTCKLACPYGYQVDESGCEICACKPAPSCCDPAKEPGTGGLPFCFEGASCCADGTWACNDGDGSPSCDPGKVCPVAIDPAK